MPTLLIRAGRHAGRALDLRPGSFEVGRGEGCQIRDPSPGLSRRHCRVEVGPDGLAVDDLGSRNGTYVNETRIDRLTPLKVGDVIRVGALTFEVVERPDATAGDSAARPPVDPRRAQEPTLSDLSGRTTPAGTPGEVPPVADADGDPAERAAEIIRAYRQKSRGA